MDALELVEDIGAEAAIAEARRRWGPSGAVSIADRYRLSRLLVGELRSCRFWIRGRGSSGRPPSPMPTRAPSRPRAAGRCTSGRQRIQGTASASGTTLDLVPNANTGTASILVSSTATYSLAGSEASVNVSRVPSSAGGVDAQFSLFLDRLNYLQWYYDGGFLYAYQSINGVLIQKAKLVYSATGHAWWRIREDGG